jgi:hypothetical protein
MQFGPPQPPIWLYIHAKIDLADGFYHLWLATHNIPNLGVVFPTYPNEEPLVTFSLTLPMGWVESPPYFCAATKTVADLANAIPNNNNLPPHPLKHLADTQPAPFELPTSPAPPLAQVYTLLGATQGSNCPLP